MSAPAQRPRAELLSWPIRIRRLQLLRREQLTPGMLRITLGGPEHVGFESHIADEHVKLVFPDEHGELRVPTPDGDHLDWPKPRPVTRDYTIRRYDPDAGEVDIDVVVHATGVATSWARDAEIGASIWVAGPPRGVHIPDEFGWQAYLGDETALPAIARRVAELPRTMRGVVYVEVAASDDEQELDVPPGMTVRWFHRDGAAPGTTTALIDAARAVTIPTGGGAYVWYGGESGAIKPLRAWVKAAGLGKGEFDLVGYWRRGAVGDEVEGHSGLVHAVKHLLRIDH